MPYGAQISLESLSRLVQQIGEQVRHVAPPELLNAGPVELRESFELWSLGLDALGHGAHSKPAIRRLARPVDRWHHQLAFGGRLAAFARSSASPLTGEHQLEELFVSPIAHRIDEGVAWVDNNADTEDHVRLLLIPACHVYTFWLESDELQSRFMVIGATGSGREKRQDVLLELPPLQMLDEASFLRKLSATASPAGVLLAGSRVLIRA
jgi:hypothetical protein